MSLRIHDLNCYPRYFRAIEEGRMTFIVSKLNPDFKVGDFLELKEFQKAKGESAQNGWHSGRSLTRRITYIERGADDHPVRSGYAVLGLMPA